MTSAWSLFLVVLPYLLQVLGVYMGYEGIQNQHLAKTGNYSPTQVNLYGPGQALAGGTLFVAGLGLHAYQGHKAVAAPPKPLPPTPLGNGSNDPLMQTLAQGEKQITDDLNAKIAAMTANAQSQIQHLRAIADSRKAGP